MTGKKRVLIVDDDEIVRLLVSKLVQNAGAEPVAAASISTVAAVVHHIDAFDLIILDLVLPTISGWDVLSAIERRTGVGKAPVVIITGALLSDDEKHSLQDRAIAVVEKEGFDATSFSSLLAACLEDRAADHEGH